MSRVRLPRAFAGLPRLFWRLWLACLINRLGTFVVPFLALFLGSGRGLAPSVVGLVVGAFGAGAMVAGPSGGALADRIGRRRTVALGVAVSLVALAVLLAADGALDLAAGAFLLGVGHELPRPAQSAMLADLVPAPDRARAYAALYWAANLGVALAGLVAGLAARASFTVLFVLDGVTSLVAGGLVLLGLPETLPQRGARARRSILADVAVPFRDPGFVGFFALTVLVALVFAQLHVAVPLDLGAHGLGPAAYGVLVSINAALIVVGQPFVGPLVDRLPRRGGLALGAALQGVGFGLLGLGHTMAWAALAIVVLTAGEMVLAPLHPAVVAELAPTHLRGTYQGAFNLSFSTAACVAPVLGSTVLEAAGGPALWGACLVLGVVAALGHLARGQVRGRAPALVAAGPPGA